MSCCYLPVIKYPSSTIDVSNLDESRTAELRYMALKRVLAARYNLEMKRVFPREHAAPIEKLKYVPCVGGCGIEHANYVDPGRKFISGWCCLGCHRRICEYGDSEHHPPRPCRLIEEDML